MLIPFSMLESPGMIRDLRPYNLPPTAWSDILNMRGKDGKFSKFPGISTVDASPLGTPYYIALHKYQETNFWVYAGLTDVWGFTDSAEAEITRAAGDYTGGVFDRWNSCSINGLFIINNGVDDPQLWSPPGLATDLVDLTNWPADTTCRVMRAFGKFLLALNVTKSGTIYDTMVKWSHSADSGVPSSWDETSATVDAGEINLWDTPDKIVDCLPLGGVNILYKENSAFLMRFIGGVLKFGFQNISRQAGIMAQDCAVALPGNKHFVFTRDDCVVHNGVDFESVIDKVNRKYWFGNLDPNAPLISFVAHLSRLSEVWICAPAFGAGVINQALVWNYRHNTWTIRDVPAVRAIAMALPSVVSEGDSWDNETSQQWNTETAIIWDEPAYLTSKEMIRFASKDNAAIYELEDDSFQDAGVDYRSYLERTGITVVGVNKDGKLASDQTQVKMLLAVWPKIEAEDGVEISIYVTAQMDQEETITWSGPYTFTVGTSDKVDVLLTGRFLGVRFEATTDDDWSLHGFELDIVTLGLH